MDLYTEHVSSFPEEYIALAAQSSSPNGTILRIPKKQSSGDMIIKFMRYKKCTHLAESDVLDLINSWVYLEDGQTPLNYLKTYFNFIINERSLTKYRIKQMYLDLELEKEDNYTIDPDYNPDLDSEDYQEELEYTEDVSESEDSYNDSTSGSGDTMNLDTTEFEFKTPGEETDYEDGDSDKSPDYVPSVESEDEYENNHRSIVKKRSVRTSRVVRKARNSVR
jgi:hypothetical protein